jgi:hypothetical protein
MLHGCEKHVGRLPNAPVGLYIYHRVCIVLDKLDVRREEGMDRIGRNNSGFIISSCQNASSCMIYSIPASHTHTHTHFELILTIYNHIDISIEIVVNKKTTTHTYLWVQN